MRPFFVQRIFCRLTKRLLITGDRNKTGANKQLQSIPLLCTLITCEAIHRVSPWECMAVPIFSHLSFFIISPRFVMVSFSLPGAAPRCAAHFEVRTPRPPT